MSYDLNKYEQSAAVGFWRMGVDSATSAAILNSTSFAVEKAIHDYKRKLNLVPKRIKPKKLIH